MCGAVCDGVCGAVCDGVCGAVCDGVCGTAHSVEDFLGLLVKIVHYNSAYLGEDVLSLLVSLTCSLANQATTPSVTEVVPQGYSDLYRHLPPPPSPKLCLSFLDAVMCYSSFPTSTIHACVVTLCHTLNIERFIQRSLEVSVMSACSAIT